MKLIKLNFTFFLSETLRISRIILLDSLLSHLFYHQTISSTNDTSDSTSKLANIDENLSKNLFEKLIQTFELLTSVLNRTLTQSLSGQIPVKIMDAIVAVTGTKSQLSGDLPENLIRSISSADKEVLNIEWKRPINLGDTSNVQQLEQNTLNVVEAHLAEIYRHQNFSIVLSLKVNFLNNFLFFCCHFLHLQ